MNKYSTIKFICMAFLMYACNSEEVMCNEDEIVEPQAVAICDKGLLIMTSEEDSALLTVFTLDSIEAPIASPLVLNSIQTHTQGNFFTKYTRPSNNDAYDPINNTYVIEYPLENRLYIYDNNTQGQKIINVTDSYSAPVFNNEILYTISIDNSGYAANPANFSINEIDQTIGIITAIVNGTFPLLSKFDWESMSSAKGANNLIYFLSGTNLVIYDINAVTASHAELTPEYSLDNFQTFYGLEYRENGNLLVIRERNDSNGEGLELLELDINNLTATPTVVFDFMANSIALNSEFYSTSYNPCDDTYYMTTRKDATTTDFYEIDLQASTFITQNLPQYLMGIASKNN